MGDRCSDCLMAHWLRWTMETDGFLCGNEQEFTEILAEDPCDDEYVDDHITFLAYGYLVSSDC